MSTADSSGLEKKLYTHTHAYTMQYFNFQNWLQVKDIIKDELEDMLFNVGTVVYAVSFDNLENILAEAWSATFFMH